MEFDSTTAMRLSQSFSSNPSIKFINNQNLASAFPNLLPTVFSRSNSTSSSTIERIKFHFVLPSNHKDWLSEFHVFDTQNFKDHFFDDSLHSLMRNGVFVKIREYQNGDLQLSIKHMLPSSENPKILFYEEFKQQFSTPPKESLFSIVQRKLKEWQVKEREFKKWLILDEIPGIFSLPAICVSRVRYSLPTTEKSTSWFVNVDYCEFNGNDPHSRFFAHGSLELDDSVCFDREKLPREIANKFDELSAAPSKILAFISTYNQDLYDKLNHEHPFIIAQNVAPPDSIVTFPSSISIMNVSVVGELTIKMPKSVLNEFTERIKEWEDHCGSEAIKKFEFLKPNTDENFEQMRYYIRFLIGLSRKEKFFREMLYFPGPEMLQLVPDHKYDDYW